MRRQSWPAFACICLFAGAGALKAQTPLTWEQVRERFRSNNPNLMAARAMTEEFRAGEITASLRPNPVLSSVNDQFYLFKPGQLKPFDTTQLTQTLSQLIERGNKRHLRVESAQLATSISRTDVADQERQLLFNLRDAFVRTLQAKSVLELATDNLAYYDKVLGVNRERYKAGDIAKVDLTRLELQRAQFDSDVVNATVSLRTAKIQLLSLMNERGVPVDSFDISGDFAFRVLSVGQGEARQTALETRPDLKSADTGIVKAEADHRLAIANGTWDPQVGFEYQRTQADNTLGFGVTLPLRIFDRNQGEKARTNIEIGRARSVRDSIVTGIYRDVDSAYATVLSVAGLIRPYEQRYLPQAAEVRDTVSFAYSHGGASLLDFLDAQKAYRDAQLAYRNLVGNYLAAVNQLSLAMGKEVLP